MSAFLSPIGNGWQFFTNQGVILAGGKINTYLAGTTTPQATYTDSTQVTPNANPIILDSTGRPTQEIWFTGGVNYKFILTDSANVTIGTWDNLSGINDITGAVSQSEWVLMALTPTYISTTQFTLPGNQTALLPPNRRVKIQVSSGLVYGFVTASSFAASTTTVTVLLDSGNLDTGISSVSYGLLSPVNPSFPALPDNTFEISGSSDVTKLLKFEVDTNISTATTVTTTARSVSGTLGLVEDQIRPITASVGSSALTITLNPTAIAFRSATLGSGTVNVRSVNTAISMVVSSGSTLGTTNAVQSRLAVIALDNAGTVELAVVNMSGGVDLSETNVITTTAEGGAGAADSANVIYSTTARTSVAYRVVGYVESTQATAGTWATAPSTIQGIGGQVKILPTAEVRLFTANGYGSTNTRIRRFTNTSINVGTDITYADSATLGGSFTINVPGVYTISYSDSFTSGSSLGLSLNGAALTTNIDAVNDATVLALTTTGSANAAGSCSWCGYLQAGSIIRAQTNAAAAGTPLAQFTITRTA